MPALTPGTTAPNFSLLASDGKTYVLDTERPSKLIVAAFFKEECPVCQLTFPFLERIHRAYQGTKLEVLGIAQNEMREAKRFALDYKLSFPQAVDDHPYRASSDYGITNVPSIFLIDHDGKILQTIVGFDKQGLIDLSQAIAQRTGKPASDVFTAADSVPDFKPG